MSTKRNIAVWPDGLDGKMKLVSQREWDKWKPAWERKHNRLIASLEKKLAKLEATKEKLDARQAARKAQGLCLYCGVNPRTQRHRLQCRMVGRKPADEVVAIRKRGQGWGIGIPKPAVQP